MWVGLAATRTILAISHSCSGAARPQPIGCTSQKRNRLKTFELGADKVYEKLDVIKQGAVSERYAKSIKAEIGTLLSEMRKAADFELFDDDNRGVLRGRLSSIEKAVDAHTTKVDGDILENLPPRKRATYKEVL